MITLDTGGKVLTAKVIQKIRYDYLNVCMTLPGGFGHIHWKNP